MITPGFVAQLEVAVEAVETFEVVAVLRTVQPIQLPAAEVEDLRGVIIALGADPCFELAVLEESRDPETRAAVKAMKKPYLVEVWELQ